jgi:5'(3')-deoxyribonucleotidase
MWVETHLGKSANKKLILCHNKGLVKGDFLIDDRIANGVADFEGEHIHFGTEQFSGWEDVLDYLGCN